VVGDLVVTPGVTMTSILGNHGKMIQACGNQAVDVMTALPRYTTAASCADPTHCTPLADPECGIKLYCGVFRFCKHIMGPLREFSNVTVVNVGIILMGKANAAPS